MKLFQFVLLIFCLCQFGTSNHYLGSRKFLNKYNGYKSKFGCFGWKNMKQETLKFLDYAGQCVQEVKTGDMNQSYINTFNSVLMEQMDDQNSTIDISRPMYNEQLVRTIKNQIVGKLNLYKCIFRMFNYIDEDDNLQFDHVLKMIKEFKLDPQLEKDIIDGMTYCRDLSNLNPSVTLPSALSPNLKRAMIFFQCEEETTEMACVRRELNYNKNDYQLEGLDGWLSDKPEDIQIMSIVYGNLMINVMSEFYETVF